VTKRTIDADAILDRAKPQVHQQPYKIQPYGHLVRLPIELSEETCRENVENLNQLLERSSTHFSLDKDASIPRPVAPPADGTVVEIPEVGGLHHRYERRAA
jgi:hypothetical protein